MRVWNLSKQRYEFNLEGHVGIISGVLITSDRRFIVSFSDETIRIWSFKKKALDGILYGHTDVIFRARITANDKYIVSCSRDCSIRIWNLEKRVQQAIISIAIPFDLIISKCCTYIISSNYDSTIRVWNFQNLQQEFILENTDREVFIALTSNNRYLFYTSEERKNIIMYNFQSRRQEAILKAHTGSIMILLVTDDSQFVVSLVINTTCTVRIWDIQKK